MTILLTLLSVFCKFDMTVTVMGIIAGIACDAFLLALLTFVQV